MAHLRWLGVLPFLGILVGIFFVNHVTPYVLGLPLPLAWIVGWICVTPAVMAVVYAADPANRTPRQAGDRA